MSIQASVTGRLTGDPELRFTPGGKAVAQLSIAVNHRKKNQAGEYEDSGATFLRASLWEYQAEQAAELLRKGQMVTARGRIETRFYKAKDGTEGSSLEMQVDDIGPAIAKWAPKNSATAAAPASNGWGNEPAQDAWGGKPASGGGSWGTPDSNGPAPF